MSFGTQGGTSYRIGDHARSNTPDGPHIAHVQSVELATTQNNEPQIKVVSHLLDMQNRQHTWYYTLTDKALFRFFQDLLALGADPNTNLGPPGPHYVDIMRQGTQGKVLDVTLSTRNDFQNTKINGVHQDGPAAGNGAFANAQPAAQPAFPSGHALAGAGKQGNRPEAVHPAGGSPWPGGGLPMQQGNPAQTGFAPATGASPEQMVDAANLFKRG